MAKKSKTKTHQVRTSFYRYLKHLYQDTDHGWHNPLTDEVISKEEINQGLERLRKLNPEGYKVLWVIYTTQKSITFCKNRLQMSARSFNNHANKAIDTLILMLQFPSILPDEDIVIYQ